MRLSVKATAGIKANQQVNRQVKSLLASPTVPALQLGLLQSDASPQAHVLQR